MTFIVTCILSVIFLLIIGITLLQMREASLQKAKNKSLNNQFRKIQTEFKELILPLYTDNIVNVITKQRLTTIATNFFVFQPISDPNIDRLFSTVESCRSVFAQCRLANSQYPEQFPSVFEELINSIPTSARDFNAHFYNITLPNAFEKFNSSVDKLSEVIESEDESDGVIDFNEEEIQKNDIPPQENTFIMQPEHEQPLQITL